METKNSYPDIYLGIQCELYRDIAQCYGVTPKQQRTEMRLIARRYKKEGISFLTKTLRSYAKAIDIALGTGTQLKTPSFARRKGIKVPKFLGWLLSRVFDADGWELSVERTDPYALKHFREFCYLFSKLEIPYDEETSREVISSFVAVDSEMALEDPIVMPNWYDDSYSFAHQSWLSDEWLSTARELITRVIAPIDPLGIKPKHGPGAVATGEDVLEKSNFSRIYSTLERVYPFTEYMMWNLNHVADTIQGGDGLSQLREFPWPTAKVVLVPKDSRGPRLISCEPLEVQWIQQGLSRVLTDRIQSCRLTKGFVNFDDQEVNRRLALEGSRTGQWVTLDMKEASDRVSLALVKYLFAGNAHLLEALLATRSCATRLPNGDLMELRKFAPMGSALCFPVESLCFWALSVSALIQHGVPRREAYRSVYVFGDDLIVGKQDYTALLRWLPSVGLRFNEGKCCTARSFRESCGCDAYVGVDVTPVKLKTVWSSSKKNPKCLESYVAFRNAMWGRGHFRVADYVMHAVGSVWGVIPATNKWHLTQSGSAVTTTAGVAWAVHESAYHRNQNAMAICKMFRNICDSQGRFIHKLRRRFNPDLQRLEWETWSSVPLTRKSDNSSYGELLRRYSAGYGPHGGVYAITRRNRLKRVWIEA